MPAWKNGRRRIAFENRYFNSKVEVVWMDGSSDTYSSDEWGLARNGNTLVFFSKKAPGRSHCIPVHNLKRWKVE